MKKSYKEIGKAKKQQHQAHQITWDRYDYFSRMIPDDKIKDVISTIWNLKIIKQYQNISHDYRKLH